MNCCFACESLYSSGYACHIERYSFSHMPLSCTVVFQVVLTNMERYKSLKGRKEKIWRRISHGRVQVIHTHQGRCTFLLYGCAPPLVSISLKEALKSKLAVLQTQRTAVRVGWTWMLFRLYHAPLSLTDNTPVVEYIGYVSDLAVINLHLLCWRKDFRGYFCWVIMFIQQYYVIHFIVQMQQQREYIEEIAGVKRRVFGANIC